MADIHGVGLLFESAANETGYFEFVFDQQDAHRFNRLTQRGAGILACRVETRLDARFGKKSGLILYYRQAETHAAAQSRDRRERTQVPGWLKAAPCRGAWARPVLIAESDANSSSPRLPSSSYCPSSCFPSSSSPTSSRLPARRQ